MVDTGNGVRAIGVARFFTFGKPCGANIGH